MVNIFLLHYDARMSVKMYSDSHVVKMTAETCQILSSILYWWNLYDAAKCQHSDKLWKFAYIKHPVVFWAQAATANAKTVCEYGNALLREYNRRYGRVHDANASIQIAVRIVMNAVTKSDALDDEHPCKLRPWILDCRDLLDAARMLHGDAYAKRLGCKVAPFLLEGEYNNACICAFSLQVPGNTKQQNKVLTDTLYHLLNSLYVSAIRRGANNCTSQIGILFHQLYYCCKIYLGTGQQRKQLAFWGFENTIPSELGLHPLPCVIESVFLHNDVPPLPDDPTDEAPRRLPSSKCRIPLPKWLVPMMHPSMILDDSSDDATSDSEGENLVPNAFA